MEDIEVSVLEFKAGGGAYQLTAEPVQGGWIICCVDRKDYTKPEVLWKQEVDDPMGQLLWRLTQVNQDQEFKDWRMKEPIRRTPAERAAAEATLQQIVAGRIDSLAMLNALA